MPTISGPGPTYVSKAARRCEWAEGAGQAMASYHDLEWGRPVLSESAMFGRLCLEAFQAGLSWSLVLRRRPALWAAFAGFDYEVLADWGPAETEAALCAPGVIRNRAKVAAVVSNARALRGLLDRGGSLVGMVWEAAFESPEVATWSLAPAKTPQSAQLARELRRAGFVFVGPTSAYATMQAAGAVNDHVVGCSLRQEVARQRAQAIAALAAGRREGVGLPGPGPGS